MRVPLSLVAPPLAALLLGACAGSEDNGPGRLATNDDPGYSASGAEVIETGADGLPKYRLRADKVRQDPATGAVALEGVDMTVSRPGADRWRVQAERGDLPSDARHVTLTGDVRLEGEALRVRTATLAYDLQGNRVAAPGEVRFEMGGRTLEANGLEADLDSRQAKLGSRVHGRFTP
jgi:LPS export ABC transporter protein LptC